MNLYLIYRPDDTDYDEYYSAVVVAETRGDAALIHPSGQTGLVCNKPDPYGSWVKLKDVKVKYLGVASNALKRGVVCASFNAG